MHPLTFLNISRTTPKRQCILVNQGSVPYLIAWKDQHSIVEQKIKDSSVLDRLILLEHPHVYTLGTGANLDFLKFDPAQTGWEVHRVERGGEVTYHCPGQLVGYPILDLRYYQQDLHWYLRQLEEVVIRVLKIYGLKGTRLTGFTGVWLEGYKIAAIGIKVRRWVTMHGFALNVCPDLSGFHHIVPCGIEDKPVGSLTQFIPVTLEQVRLDVATAFSEVFQVDFVQE